MACLELSADKDLRRDEALKRKPGSAHVPVYSPEVIMPGPDVGRATFRTLGSFNLNYALVKVKMTFSRLGR